MVKGSRGVTKSRSNNGLIVLKTVCTFRVLKTMKKHLRAKGE